MIGKNKCEGQICAVAGPIAADSHVIKLAAVLLAIPLPKKRFGIGIDGVYVSISELILIVCKNVIKITYVQKIYVRLSCQIDSGVLDRTDAPFLMANPGKSSTSVS